MAEARIEPFGETRDDWRMAVVASTIVNANPYRKGRGVKASDFMPEFGKRRAQAPREMEAMCRVFAAAHNQALASKKTTAKKKK